MNKSTKYIISLIVLILSCTSVFSQTTIQIGTGPNQLSLIKLEDQLVGPSIFVNNDEDFFFIADKINQQIKIFTRNGDLHQVMDIPISQDLLHFSVTDTRIIIGYPTIIEIWDRGASSILSTHRNPLPMSNYQILTGQGLIQIVYLGVNNILQILEETSSNEILRLSIKDLKAPILFNGQNSRIPINNTIESMEFHIAAIRNNGNIWWERNYNGYTRFILQNQHEEKLRDIQIKNSEVFSRIFGNTELFVCTMTATELKIITQ